MPDQLIKTASPWVRRFLSLIPKNDAPVLDLACGSGRHTRLLLNAGHDVWALDRDESLFSSLELLGARCFQFDLETRGSQPIDAKNGCFPFQENTFSAIVVTNYLYRPLLPLLMALLKENGVLIYETFAVGNEVFGRPRNPEFLLRSGELLQQFMSNTSSDRKAHCIAYEHGRIDSPRPALVQRICVRSISASADTSMLLTCSDQLDGN